LGVSGEKAGDSVRICGKMQRAEEKRGCKEKGRASMLQGGTKGERRKSALRLQAYAVKVRGSGGGWGRVEMGSGGGSFCPGFDWRILVHV